MVTSARLVWISEFPLKQLLIYMIFQLQVTHVHNVSTDAKTANNLPALMIQEMEYIKGPLGMCLIGWVSDAGGESHTAHVHLGRCHPRLLIANCISHQVCVSRTLKSNNI
jgi:hypothetical protein